MAYVAGNRNTTISLGMRLNEIRTGLVEAYQAWRVYRTTLDELQALTGRELADLGIHRSNIRSVAMEAAYGKQG